MRVDTSLLREKFTITEKTAENSNKTAEETHACSNRIVLNLQSEGLARETFVVRTDSMHLCARMAGQILANYENRGPFLPRLKYMKWHLLWDGALSDYERRHNQRRWVAVYHKGRVVFEEGSHHVFLDIIEQFEHEEQDEYARSLAKAESAFNEAGKKVMIDYASNVALALSMDRKGGRCSTILRAPNKTTAFHYYIRPLKENEKVAISQGLLSAADFLEGVNLSYFIGITKAQLECGEIDKYAEEVSQMRMAQKRIQEINVRIDAFERRYALRYRPERPLFHLITAQTENYARTALLANPVA